MRNVFLSIPGVVGTGISRDAEGHWVIEVYVSATKDSLPEELPEELEGIPVRVVETGPFEAHR